MSTPVMALMRSSTYFIIFFIVFYFCSVTETFNTPPVTGVVRASEFGFRSAEGAGGGGGIALGGTREASLKKAGDCESVLLCVRVECCSFCLCGLVLMERMKLSPRRMKAHFGMLLSFYLPSTFSL